MAGNERDFDNADRRWNQLQSAINNWTTARALARYFRRVAIFEVLRTVPSKFQRFLAALMEMVETFQAEPCFLLTIVITWPPLLSVNERLPRIVRGVPTSWG